MGNPRTDLHAFAKEVKRVIDMQRDYFRGKHNTSVPQVSLHQVKKAEKQLLGLINMINLDRAEMKQANLFEDTRQSLLKKAGLNSGDDLLLLYGQEVSFEWLNNSGDAWIPAKGKVSAVTLRHAEMGRVRNLTVETPSPDGHSSQGETGGSDSYKTDWGVHE